ncbi:MAG: tripartite tricarboxylate transporter substrate binding protein, partial [Pigmentiphaga sp.]
MNIRRQLLKSMAVAPVALNSSAFAFSASKPVRVIVPNATGGGMDILARTICHGVAAAIKETLIVENRPGAATAIGAAEASRAAGDGYTLLIADNGTMTINPLIYKQLNYAPAQDFTPISLLAKFPMIFACGSLVKETSIKEIIASRSKEKPFTYGSPGLGSPHHLAMELFSKLTGMPIKHVPYKGAAPAVQDVASGQIDGMMVDYAAGRAMLATGKVRPIAVANEKRLHQLPEVPTFEEVG